MTHLNKIKTGFEVYDHELGGMEKGQLILVEGTPCNGKASFALSLVDNLCNNNEGTCLYFSVETNPNNLFKKILKKHCEIKSLDQMSTSDWEDIAKEGRKLSEYNLIIEGYEVTVEKILSKSIEVACSEQISAIVVDGVSYIADSRGRRIYSVYPILQKLKELAIVLNCPVIAYTTLSRFRKKSDEDCSENIEYYNATNSFKAVDEVFYLYHEETSGNDGDNKKKINVGTMNYVSGKSCSFEMEFAC